MSQQLTDHSLMPFGKYQGQPMANVPDEYLIYLYSQYMDQVRQGKEIRGDSHSVLLYIEDYGIENLKP